MSRRSVLSRCIQRVLRTYHSKRQQRMLSGIRARLTVRDVTILSQNCIGGVFYHDMGLQFCSPTINLFFKEPDFVRFAMDPMHYLGCTPEISMGPDYPIGQLDDIQIHFMHYKTCQEALTAWERRKQRIHPEKLLVIATDRNGFDDEVFALWQRIPYPKVLFTAQPRYAQEPGTVFFSQFRDLPHVPDLIPDRLFYQDDILLNAVNGLGGTQNDRTRPC